MRISRIRHLAAVGALALITAAPLAACGAESLAPLPVEAAGAEPAVTESEIPARQPSASAPTGTSAPRNRKAPAAAVPTKTKTTEPVQTNSPSSCHGAVRYDLDLQNTVLDLQKSMCFHTGGVLRLQGIGPGLVTATPEDLVSPSYAGGVQDLRFVRPGTVTVTIPQDERTDTITVVVIS